MASKISENSVSALANDPTPINKEISFASMSDSKCCTKVSDPLNNQNDSEERNCKINQVTNQGKDMEKSHKTEGDPLIKQNDINEGNCKTYQVVNPGEDMETNYKEKSESSSVVEEINQSISLLKTGKMISVFCKADRVVS